MCCCIWISLQKSGLAALQHMRVPNSGTASPRDIDLGWEQLQAAALQTLVLERNARPDGRGLSDLRELRCEVEITQRHIYRSCINGSKDASRGKPHCCMSSC